MTNSPQPFDSEQTQCYAENTVRFIAEWSRDCKLQDRILDLLNQFLAEHPDTSPQEIEDALDKVRIFLGLE